MLTLSLSILNPHETLFITSNPPYNFPCSNGFNNFNSLSHTHNPPAYTPPPRKLQLPQKKRLNDPPTDLTDVEKSRGYPGDETLPHSTNAGRHHNSTNDNTQTMLPNPKEKKKTINQTKDTVTTIHFERSIRRPPVSHQSAIYAVAKHRI